MLHKIPRESFNIKMLFYECRDSHYKDKMVSQLLFFWKMQNQLLFQYKNKIHTIINIYIAIIFIVMMEIPYLKDYQNVFLLKCALHLSLMGELWGAFCDLNFLHAKPWILGGEISIFTAVIHQWRSPLRQFARAMTIDKYDVTIPAFRVFMTSQISCGDVTMLGQKRPPLATMAKWALDDCS